MSIKALTSKEVKLFEKLGEQDVPNPTVVAKFFLPTHGFYWYFTSLDVDPTSDQYGIGFGFANLADPMCAELGYIDLFELLNINRRYTIDRKTEKLTDIRIGGPEACFGVVERDIYFEPTPLQPIIDQVKA